MTKEVLVLLYSALVRTYLEYAIQANCLPSYHLERTQWTATRWVKCLRDLDYEERLKAKKIQSFEKERIINSQIDQLICSEDQD